MDSDLKLIKLWYICGLMMLLAVATLSLMPAPDVGVNDKVSHLITYAILAGWFSLLIKRKISLLWILSGLIAYGGVIELLQSTTADRYAEWADVLANSIGIGAGLLLFFSPLPGILRRLDQTLARFCR